MVKLNGFVQAVGDVIGRTVRVLPPNIDAIVRWGVERSYRLVSGREMSLALTRSVRYPHARATAVLGYAPRIRLADGMRMMAEQYELQSLDVRRLPSGLSEWNAAG